MEKSFVILPDIVLSLESVKDGENTKLVTQIVEIPTEDADEEYAEDPTIVPMALMRLSKMEKVEEPRKKESEETPECFMAEVDGNVQGFRLRMWVAPKTLETLSQLGPNTIKEIMYSSLMWAKGCDPDEVVESIRSYIGED